MILVFLLFHWSLQSPHKEPPTPPTELKIDVTDQAFHLSEEPTTNQHPHFPIPDKAREIDFILF